MHCCAQNLSKSKDALSATEQSLRAKDLELQRLGMDLIAKKSECTGLEAQVGRGRSMSTGPVSGMLQLPYSSFTNCYYRISSIYLRFILFTATPKHFLPSCSIYSRYKLFAESAVIFVAATHITLAPTQKDKIILGQYFCRQAITPISHLIRQ